jgi:TPR repeat protein
MNDPPACVFAGQMHEYAHGVPKDNAKAAALYERACRAGWAAGCYNQAIMLENGRGVPQQLDKAASLYDTACAAGAKAACEKAKALRSATATDAH